MINWVIASQLEVALYIYRVGEILPRKKSFTGRKLLEYLNSTWTQGPPVRALWPVWLLLDRLQDTRRVKPSRDTGLTGGVSPIGFVPIFVRTYAPYFLVKFPI
jgi:hypothetical protein